MHALKIEGVELASYLLKDVVYQWYEGWELSRCADSSLASQLDFFDAFLDRFFPQELREAKAEEFIKLKQVRMSIQEYALKFHQLSRYSLEMVASMRVRMRKFVSRLSRELVLQSKAALLIENIDISRLIVCMQQVENDKKKQVELSEKKERKFRPSKQSGSKWPLKKQGSLGLFSSASDHSPYPKFLGDHRPQFSGTVGFEHRLPNSKLVVPSQLHPTLLADSVVKVIVVSMRKGETGFFIEVRLGTCNVSAPLQYFLGLIGPLLLLYLLIHQRILCLPLFLFLAPTLVETACMPLPLARISRHLPILLWVC